LVFAFYRHTCRALRNHISREIERRTLAAGRRSLGIDDVDSANHEIESRLEKIQRRYFDDVDSPGRRTVDAALDQIIRACESATDGPTLSVEQHDLLRDVMRRFLRVQTTLVRCFPMAELDSIAPDAAVSQLLDHADASEVSWRRKFADFAGFLMARCSSDERKLYLEATGGTRTGDIRVSNQDDDSSSGRLANVREATGETARHTRARLMRAFNTPFFPDVLVCSQVMGEGVDLQRYCRHVIHHDLAWNPSTIEQRTGRIDRLGCKAEGRHPIHVDLPYLAGTADERTYRVMSDREQWFRVVMGQDEVAKLITPDSTGSVRLPDAVAAALSFELSLSKSTP
ncbi:MAG: C-terminal helicase domain-containing protein, partial [Planctomycetaceae bacterium]